MLLYAGQASLHIIEPGFMYFSMRGRSVALFLLLPVRPFKTTNLRLLNLSIPPNNHNCFSTGPLLNLHRTITVSSIFTSTPSPPIESWLLNQVSVTSEQNDRQSTDVLNGDSNSPWITTNKV